MNSERNTRRRSRSRTFVLGVLGAAWLPVLASAQCGPQWFSAGARRGTDNSVNSLTKLPNGDVVVGGQYTIVNDLVSGAVSFFHPSTSSFTPPGPLLSTNPGSPSTVLATARMMNGDVIVAGSFSLTTPQVFARIARWDGSAWNPLGTGCNNTVRALLPMADGSLIAGGNFTLAGGVAVNAVARWTGTQWQQIGFGFQTNSSPGTVRALGLDANGDIIAGGSFNRADAVPCQNLARWNGSGWAQVAGGAQGGVFALAPTQAGGLIVAGSFTSVSNADTSLVPNTLAIAIWNGSTWSPVGTGSNAYNGGNINAVLTTTNGNIWAGTTGSALRWNGSTWQTTGAIGSVNALAELDDGSILAAGSFTIDNSIGRNIFRWDGSAWQMIGNNLVGLEERVAGLHSMQSLPNGSIVAATISAVPGESLILKFAKWDGSTFTSFASNMRGTSPSTAYWNGQLVAGTVRPVGTGNELEGIYAWNGTSWNQLGPSGSNLYFSINDMTTLQDGSLVVCGSFSRCGEAVGANGIARWNGTAWETMGTGVNVALSESLSSMIVMPNGNLVVAGNFSSINGVTASNAAMWNGSTWSAMGSGGSGIGSTSMLALTPDGRVVSSSMKVWDGTAWVSFGNSVPGSVTKLKSTASGHLVLQTLVTPSNIRPLYIWNGSAWSEMNPTVNSIAFDMASLGNGDLVVGGWFTGAGSLASTNIIRWGVPDSCRCDSIDFNNDTSLFDPQDIDAFLSVYGEGPCVPQTATCNDIDFNNDNSVFDPCDIDSFLYRFAEGPCTQCGQ